MMKFFILLAFKAVQILQALAIKLAFFRFAFTCLSFLEFLLSHDLLIFTGQISFNASLVISLHLVEVSVSQLF